MVVVGTERTLSSGTELNDCKTMELLNENNKKMAENDDSNADLETICNSILTIEITKKEKDGVKETAREVLQKKSSERFREEPVVASGKKDLHIVVGTIQVKDACTSESDDDEAQGKLRYNDKKEAVEDDECAQDEDNELQSRGPDGRPVYNNPHSKMFVPDVLLSGFPGEPAQKFRRPTVANGVIENGNYMAVLNGFNDQYNYKYGDPNQTMSASSFPESNVAEQHLIPDEISFTGHNAQDFPLLYNECYVFDQLDLSGRKFPVNNQGCTSIDAVETDPFGSANVDNTIIENTLEILDDIDIVELDKFLNIIKDQTDAPGKSFEDLDSGVGSPQSCSPPSSQQPSKSPDRRSVCTGSPQSYEQHSPADSGVTDDLEEVSGCWIRQFEVPASKLGGGNYIFPGGVIPAECATISAPIPTFVENYADSGEITGETELECKTINLGKKHDQQPTPGGKNRIRTPAIRKIHNMDEQRKQEVAKIIMSQGLTDSVRVYPEPTFQGPFIPQTVTQKNGILHSGNIKGEGIDSVVSSAGVTYEIQEVSGSGARGASISSKTKGTRGALAGQSRLVTILPKPTSISVTSIDNNPQTNVPSFSAPQNFPQNPHLLLTTQPPQIQQVPTSINLPLPNIVSGYVPQPILGIPQMQPQLIVPTPASQRVVDVNQRPQQPQILPPGQPQQVPRTVRPRPQQRPPQRSREDELRVHREVADITNERLVMQDENGYTLLHKAALYGEVTFLKAEALICRLRREKLLDQVLAMGGIQNQTPLCIAVFYNHPETVKLLLDNGADPNVRIIKFLPDGKNEYNLLHYIATKGSTMQDTLQHLLDDKRTDVNVYDSQGLTPLHWAVRHHSPKCQQNNGMVDSQSVIFRLAMHGADLNIMDRCTGKTPLHYAIEKRDRALIDWYLDLTLHIARQRHNSTMGPPEDAFTLQKYLGARTRDGLNALDIAFSLKADSHQKEEIIALLQKKALRE